jgi:hypothetical protein
MDETRSRVVNVIRQVADALARGEEGDDLLHRACRDAGVTAAQYKQALEEDPALALLEREARIEAVAGTPDPGPHDAISRESPSGQPGDLQKNRSPAAREATLGGHRN